MTTAAVRDHMPTKRTETLRIRCSLSERDEIDERARDHALTRSAYVRRAALGDLDPPKVDTIEGVVTESAPVVAANPDVREPLWARILGGIRTRRPVV